MASVTVSSRSDFRISWWLRVKAPGMSRFISWLYLLGGKAAAMPNRACHPAATVRAVLMAGHRSESALMSNARSVLDAAASATRETAMSTSVSFFS
jgi:hypothetical protein